MLDQRLSACAQLIRPDAKVCDVGTDHAYLPCFLAQTGHHPGIIAADVNEKPLESARNHIKERGFSHLIRTILSDGLEKIDETDADDIIIAGMGGELIARILLSCPWAENKQKHFILQPMTNADTLRVLLYQNGFQIKQEIPAIDNGHYYTAMLCTYCGKKQEISPLFSLIGKIPQTDIPQRDAYLSYQAGRMRKIAAGMERSSKSAPQAQAFYQLAEEIEKLRQER